MARVLTRICCGCRSRISDMFYVQYTASYPEACEFDDARRLALEIFGKGKNKK